MIQQVEKIVAKVIAERAVTLYSKQRLRSIEKRGKLLFRIMA